MARISDRTGQANGDSKLPGGTDRLSRLWLLALAGLCLALAACALLTPGAQPAGQGDFSPPETQAAPPATLVQGGPTLQPPAATAPPTYPAAQSIWGTARFGGSPTAPASATPGYTDPQELRRGLALRLGSPEWGRLGLPVALTQRAEAYLQSDEALAQEDARALAAVLAQWDALDRLARRRLVPSPASLMVLANLPAQADTPVLYVRRSQPGVSAGSQPIFLPIQPEEGAGGDAAAGLGLAQAPELAGFTQQIGGDGRSVLYLDAQGRPVVSAAMQAVDEQEIKQRTLLDQLVKVYGEDDPYVRAGVFPRFHFLVDGIGAAFYGLDRSLSTPQVVLLRETFQVYDRPALETLKPAMFGPGVSVVLMDRLKDAAGLNYSGTGIIVLDRRDLFGNKYQLAQVLAHEASHVLQGELGPGEICPQLLQREVAQQTIPVDFLAWQAERLLEGIQAKEVGAYHVSLWMLTQLGIHNTDWLYRIIHTGTANGQSLLIGCDP